MGDHGSQPADARQTLGDRQAPFHQGPLRDVLDDQDAAHNRLLGAEEGRAGQVDADRLSAGGLERHVLGPPEVAHVNDAAEIRFPVGVASEKFRSAGGGEDRTVQRPEAFGGGVAERDAEVPVEDDDPDGGRLEQVLVEGLEAREFRPGAFEFSCGLGHPAFHFAAELGKRQPRVERERQQVRPEFQNRQVRRRERASVPAIAHQEETKRLVPRHKGGHGQALPVRQFVSQRQAGVLQCQRPALVQEDVEDRLGAEKAFGAERLGPAEGGALSEALPLFQEPDGPASASQKVKDFLEDRLLKGFGTLGRGQCCGEVRQERKVVRLGPARGRPLRNAFRFCHNSP